MRHVEGGVLKVAGHTAGVRNELTKPTRLVEAIRKLDCALTVDIEIARQNNGQWPVFDHIVICDRRKEDRVLVCLLLVEISCKTLCEVHAGEVCLK